MSCDPDTWSSHGALIAGGFIAITIITIIFCHCLCVIIVVSWRKRPFDDMMVMISLAQIWQVLKN